MELNIKIVENMEELLMAFTVRAIVYIHEQSCPYLEEFDLNDFTCTQILGTIGSEPVLCARIRYFGQTAKVERIAVRSEYRNKGYAHELLRYIISFCENKGFDDFYLHAAVRLEAFYNSYGFKKVGGQFGFSDHDYIEMRRTQPSLEPKALQIVDPMIINRPENNPTQCGPLERVLKQTDKGRRLSIQNKSGRQLAPKK